MIQRRIAVREEHAPKVCFELVGCFVDPPQHLTLKRPPQHPNEIKTRFLLYTRKQREVPDVIYYGDNSLSIEKSGFNSSKALKVVVHGYKGSGTDLGAINGALKLLDVEDANVMLLDWTRGAGTSYSAAVANTELVGRQLSLVLLDAIKLGTSPKNIHIIGFSLGAHVAGCASEVLKKRKYLIGRITGLDPASPFFRHHLFRERSRKLDASDANLVDVIHTDGSDDFSDGFGLLKPIGHIDFFPNGGREQPGCSDVKNAVVVSHLNDDYLDRSIACSHLRAWQLFVDTIESQDGECKFQAWPCSVGGASFNLGNCFPPVGTKWYQEMGYAANRGPLGIYYLATRDKAPFCGEPFRAMVETTKEAPRTRGMLFLRINHGNSTTLFKIPCYLFSRKVEPFIFYNIAATEYRAITENTKKIRGNVWYRAAINEAENNNTTVEPIGTTLYLNKLIIEDRKGNRWTFCQSKTAVDYLEEELILQNGICIQ
ncbi:pancreatic triacylglycerol lipase-like isoform X2 [Belonocnema kinseyi]|nr:pancreatic triacylglycerol lipase-like isoform X2 [Belonocnema kinseyi]XP_033224047.1 pancreatic triacylglycerol lipase-like isoform X2 [Belonocnema kinseyi]XP_033224048.1 pancreatic triacylglycerol lipase-like isoform X2 [Belonocnema kinseyi]